MSNILAATTSKLTIRIKDQETDTIAKRVLFSENERNN